jgi:hypothetical protein
MAVYPALVNIPDDLKQNLLLLVFQLAPELSATHFYQKESFHFTFFSSMLKIHAMYIR